MKLDRIRELLMLMESHGLEELELEDGGFKVRLKKESQGKPVPVHAAPAAAPLLGASANAPAGASAGAPAAEAEAEAAGRYTITSPIVGTFYHAPSPDAEPFVEIGDPVEADTVVCIVEAMKVMNEVKAEVQGTVEKMLVETGKPVEYGQPLFLVATS